MPYEMPPTVNQMATSPGLPAQSPMQFCFIQPSPHPAMMPMTFLSNQLPMGVPEAPAVSMSILPTMMPVAPASVDMQPQMNISLTQQMELVWHGEFGKFFDTLLPDHWKLVPEDFHQELTQGADERGWKMFKDSAKVRFCCQRCGLGWTSMKGRVVFWYRLEDTYPTKTGLVRFKLFGQKCDKCPNDGTFEHAMWYPEEVSKVIGNVYNRIGQMYYGFQRPPLRVDRRVGKPRQQHNASLCQACQEGLCREEWVL